MRNPMACSLRLRIREDNNIVIFTPSDIARHVSLNTVTICP